MGPRYSSGNRAKQRGAALLILMLIILLATIYTIINALSAAQINVDRQFTTSETLVQSKDALIGKAVAERKNNLFGYLQLPDLGTSRNSTPNEGTSAGNFSGNAKNLTVIGRLPWRTLGLPPLKDANGECLWYAVSGANQVAQPPDVFNWDTVGHFELFSSDGTSTGTVSASGSNLHDRPLALVFSAGQPLPGQNRGASAIDTVTECGGNYDVHNYLDSYVANANINNIVNYFTGTTNNATGDASSLTSPKYVITGDVEVLIAGNKIRIADDRVLTITTKDIFDRIKKRSDFKTDIDSLLDDLASYLNSPTVSLPIATGDKGMDSVVSACLAYDACAIKGDAQKKSVLSNWKDNLLYAGGPTGNFTINGTPTICAAVLLFSGERAAGQNRSTSIQKLAATNYLEGTNASQFPAYGNYTGTTYFDRTNTTTDIVRCIKGT